MGSDPFVRLQIGEQIYYNDDDGEIGEGGGVDGDGVWLMIASGAAWRSEEVRRIWVLRTREPLYWEVEVEEMVNETYKGDFH